MIPILMPIPSPEVLTTTNFTQFFQATQAQFCNKDESINIHW